MQMRERRQVPRYQFKASGRLLSSSNQPVAEITFTTLSVRGCGAHGLNLPAVGQTCQLSFEWEKQEFHSEVEVRWKSPDGRGGFMFAALDQASLDLIRRICASLHLEPLPPPTPESNEE